MSPAGDSPLASGFRMPAEWEPHRATWLAWPHREEDWDGKLAAVEWVYVEIVRAIARDEAVRILVPDRGCEERVAEYLKLARVDPARVSSHVVPTDRSWVRDSGPLFVVSGEGEVAATDWRFNAWAKYPEWELDNRLPAAISAITGHRRLVAVADLDGHTGPVVLEGGSIDVNGGGLLLTTEECLLSPVQARNPGLRREELERCLLRYLGARRVLWLGRGIAGDDTHGHVDDAARFAGPRTVVAAIEEDRGDENHDPLRENFERLRAMRDIDGRPLEVVTLPMPRPLYFGDLRLPASYLNFYITNRSVLVPTFNDPRDRQALDILAGVFGGREVVGIHAVDLVLGLGTIHCLTQQEPAGRRGDDRGGGEE